MSLNKQINEGEMYNFVRNSIKASFGETKVNNVDMMFGDILQGYDKDNPRSFPRSDKDNQKYSSQRDIEQTQKH